MFGRIWHLIGILIGSSTLVASAAEALPPGKVKNGALLVSGALLLASRLDKVVRGEAVPKAGK